MKPLIKRALAVLAVKKAVSAYQDYRRPRTRSLLARARLPVLVATAGGAAVYLGRGGRLRALADGVGGISRVEREPGSEVSAPVGPSGDGPGGAPGT
jgi:hypothetical protein